MSLLPPKVAIIGRTNVGKSTLFNRLIEQQKSMVSDIPGTTRDRFEADCIWRGQVIRLIDTGGLNVKQADEIERDIVKQAKLAIKEADVVVLVVDLKTGLQNDDRHLANELLKSKKPIIVVGNKADNAPLRAKVNEKEWFNWPLGQPLPVSAKRGSGTGDLLDEIFKKLEAQDIKPIDVQDVAVTRVAVLGRPNVGKSSLLNALLGQHRFITSEKEFTTREPNDTLITVDGNNYLFVDTAGVRRLARVHAGKSTLEKSGVERSLTAARRADVVLLILDITQKIHAQDKYLAGLIHDSGTSVIIIANKWDLIPEKDPTTINRYEEYLRYHLPMLRYAPIIFTSALTRKRVPELFDVINKVYSSRFTQLDDVETKAFISRAIARHLPSRGRGVAHPRITAFEQTAVNPPSFRLSIKQKRRAALSESYLRFLENLLRQHYDFEGTPIKIFVSTGKRASAIKPKDTQQPMSILIAGLGNPGDQYQNTRHNVGFMVLDELAVMLDANFSTDEKLKADVAEINLEGQKVILMKPQTFMNKSGEALAAAKHHFKLKDASDIWLVHDDATLPFGILRVRMEGSSGGHKGVQSAIDYLKEEDFVRFRLGIGEPSEPMALEDWVLAHFSKDEEEQLLKMIHGAAQKIKKGLTAGVNSLTENLAE